jgi:protein-S-isoprenylcysteine O-methyltransferase Ste14
VSPARPLRLPELGRRGEGWVALQLLLIAAVVGCGLAGPSWPASVEPFLAILGLLVMIAGFGLLVVGTLALGRSLTPLPHPRDDGRLREHGVFARARHPIYGAVIVLALGWSLVSSPLALIAAGLLAGLLELKSRREEAWLVERYPEYEAYRARTPHRFLPWLF